MNKIQFPRVGLIISNYNVRKSAYRKLNIKTQSYYETTLRNHLQDRVFFIDKYISNIDK